MGLYAGREPWRQKLISSEVQSNVIFLLQEGEWKIAGISYHHGAGAWKMLWEGPGLMYLTGCPYQGSRRALLKMNVIPDKSVQTNRLPVHSRQLIKMWAGCTMWIQVWPLTNLKFTSLLSDPSWFPSAFTLAPGGLSSYWVLLSEPSTMGVWVFLNLSFWATFSKPLLCPWYQCL